ncbi:hypothetical protein RJ640_019853 [Escallonia rubra]|uniref:rRNA-processing protein FYV7 n=1 Tax=Escallonia rubra TaxID=112253 RepID=A0AA88RIV8_9ASTE|nr:hypothetical protein RJ640_019853 [Escallonia rubra]
MKDGFTKQNPNEKNQKMKGPGWSNQKSKKNRMRLGGGGGKGGGLSLQVFANAKSKNDHYNPAIIKKQREFYKNAKFVSKYKKSQKEQRQQSNLFLEQSQQSDPFLEQSQQPDPFLEQSQQNDPLAARPLEDQNEFEEAGKVKSGKKKKKKITAHSLKEVYDKTHEEEEKARIKREAINQAKKEERETAESRRKALRERMFKKTRSGQPVMKYRIEHLLQTLQGST